MILNRAIVSTMVMASIGSFAANTHASTMDPTPAPKTTNNLETVAYNYDVTFDEALANLKSTTSKLETMRKSGVVSGSLLEKLQSEVRELESAMIRESSEATIKREGLPQDVITAWVDAGVVATGIDGSEAVKARAAVDQMLNYWGIGVNIDSYAESEYGGQTVEVDTSNSTNNTPTSDTPVEAPKEDTSNEIEVPNFNATNMSDIGGHWAEGTIKRMVADGAVTGFTDGTFKPNKTITKEEFVAILMRTVTRKTYPKAEPGQTWSEPVIEDARREGVITRYDLKTGTYQDPISRAEMARFTAKALTNVLGEQYITNNIDNVDKYITDINTFRDKAYTHDVRQVYAKGIIQGNDDGEFMPDRSASRAEAATIIERVKDKSRRKEVDLEKQYDFSISITEPKVIDSRVSGLARNVKPMPGDTFIKKDGTKVILKVGPRGVLGEGQGLDLYGGMTRADGKVVQAGNGVMGSYFIVPDGTTGDKVSYSPSLGVTTDDSFIGQPYEADIHGNHHFKNEWIKIQNYDFENILFKVENPQKGERYGYGKNFIYDGSTWTWDPMHEQTADTL